MEIFSSPLPAYLSKAPSSRQSPQTHHHALPTKQTRAQLHHGYSSPFQICHHNLTDAIHHHLTTIPNPNQFCNYHHHKPQHHHQLQTYCAIEKNDLRKERLKRKQRRCCPEIPEANQPWALLNIGAAKLP
jgi:hypothetical protein